MFFCCRHPSSREGKLVWRNGAIMLGSSEKCSEVLTITGVTAYSRFKDIYLSAVFRTIYWYGD